MIQLTPERQQALDGHLLSKRDRRQPPQTNPSIKPDIEMKCQGVGNNGNKNNWTELSLDSIVIDEAFKVRATANNETVKEYAQRFVDYREEVHEDADVPYPFEPVWVFERNDENVLIAGNYRFGGAKKAKEETIRAFIFEGSEDEALLFAIKDNSKHGLRYSKGDLAICIEKVLKRHPDMSLAKLKDITGASKSHCSEVRTKLRNDEGFGTEPLAKEKNEADAALSSPASSGKKNKTTPIVYWKRLKAMSAEDQIEKIMETIIQFAEDLDMNEKLDFMDKVLKWMGTQTKLHLEKQ